MKFDVTSNVKSEVKPDVKANVKSNMKAAVSLSGVPSVSRRCPLGIQRMVVCSGNDAVKIFFPAGVSVRTCVRGVVSHSGACVRGMML